MNTQLIKELQTTGEMIKEVLPVEVLIDDLFHKAPDYSLLSASGKMVEGEVEYSNFAVNVNAVPLLVGGNISLEIHLNSDNISFKLHDELTDISLEFKQVSNSGGYDHTVSDAYGNDLMNFPEIIDNYYDDVLLLSDVMETYLNFRKHRLADRELQII